MGLLSIAFCRSICEPYNGRLQRRDEMGRIFGVGPRGAADESGRKPYVETEILVEIRDAPVAAESA
jgi:hypothetical protein